MSMSTSTADVMPSITDELDALGTIGLMKLIAAGEAEGGRRLLDWAAVTKRPEVAETLRFIAARERSHADVFSRRISELGDAVDLTVVPEQAAYLVMLADPAIADAEKGKCILGGEEFFAEIERRAAGGIFDPLTAKLMTWYVAEERDSQARLRQTGVCG
jgi:hypothetical protein